MVDIISINLSNAFNIVLYHILAYKLGHCELNG